MITFDVCGESNVYTIGNDLVYFQRDGEDESITVLMAGTGEPYSRTNQYIEFESQDETERFLSLAQLYNGFPNGWE